MAAEPHVDPDAPELSGLGLVFLGRFEPSSFQPSWFAEQDLLRSEEVATAKINLFHNEVVNFALDWLILEAHTNRLSIQSTTRTAQDELVRDLAAGTLRLTDASVAAFGINHERHYAFGSDRDWHAFGHRLVSPQNWDSFLKQPGMRTLDVQGVRPDDADGYIRVRVEPSVRIKQSVYIRVNDHIELAPATDPLPSPDAANALLEQWDAAQARAQAVFEGLLDSR